MIPFKALDTGLADLHAGHTAILPQECTDALFALGCLGLIQPYRRFYRIEDCPGRQLRGRNHNVE